MAARFCFDLYEHAMKFLNFIRADGYYEGTHVPNSYIVLNIDEVEVLALAKSFAQYSLIIFNKNKAKLLYLRGKNKNHFYLAQSWSETPLSFSDYTAVKTKDKLFKFTYNLDFNVLLKYEIKGIL